MGAVETTNLGAFLATAYNNLELVGESVGKAIWSGWEEHRRFAVRCIADWSFRAEERDQLEARISTLAKANLTCIPRPLKTLDCDRHLLIVEEWIEGRKWKHAILSRDMALETAVELSDLLGELHQLGIVHGRVKPENLIVDDSTGRLKLLGLLTELPDPAHSPESDLRAACRCLQPFLTEEEAQELSGASSSRELSKRVSRLLAKVTPGLHEPQFVGREHAINQLNGCWPQGGLVLVEAPAGGGKTRLMREWTTGSQGRILWAKADREVAPSPFKLFQAPFAQLEQELPTQPELLDQLRAELDVELPLLDSLRSEGSLQRGTLVWLAKLLSLLHENRPTVLVLDDCQWADELTIRFLEFWSTHNDGGLVVATYRPEELGPKHVLRHLSSSRIQLPALSPSQAGRLLKSAEPSASQTLVESAVRRAQGNPFLLLQLLRSGQLQGDLQQALLSKLSSAARGSLAAASVLGREFTEELLSACLDEEPALEQALNQGLVERCARGLRFFHDRFREACYYLLSSDEIANVHRRAASFLEKTQSQDVFAVAYHFHAAGSATKGLPYALRAADVARKKHDLSTAIFYLQAAQGGADSSADLAKLNYDLGDCFRLTGRYQKSLECFQRALKLCHSELDKARTKHAIGDVYFKQAQLKKAQTAIVEGLQLLGDRPPQWQLGSFLAEACRLMARSTYSSKKALESAERDLTRASLYNRLAYVNWFLEGPIPSIWAHLCELNIAERYPDTPQLARAQANHAMAMSAIPWWSRALKYGRKALTTARTLGDQWGQGQAGHFYGAALLGACRLKEAEAHLVEARRLLERTGDRWEENGVCYHLALTYYRLGALDKAAALAMRTQQIGVEINDRLAAGDNLNTWARACHGRLPRGPLEEEKKHSSPDLQRASELLCAEALGAIRNREYQHAEELLEKAWLNYQSKRVQNLYSAFIPCWLSTARRLRAQTCQGRERARCLARARKSVKLALRLARNYQTNLPHALRESALLEILSGNHQRGRELLVSSSGHAKAQGMVEEERTSTEIMHRYSWLLGGKAQPRTSGTQIEWLLGEQNRKADLGSAQLRGLLEAASAISNCLSRATTLHQLCQGAASCLGLPVTAVVRVNEAGLVEQLSGDFQTTLPAPPFEEARWFARSLVGLAQPAYLLIRTGRYPLSEQEELLVDFLIAIAGAALDRAARTMSSTVLTHDLQESSLRLDEKSIHLSRAREQLLLSERLALTGRLAAGLVHDLRNLVMGITGNAQVLEMDTPPNEHQPELSDILSAGKKAAQLLEHLGGLSRGDIIGAQKLDVNRRLNETRSLFSSLCGPMVELEFALDYIEHVLVDPIQFDRIMLNLIVNARDAVGLGGSVEISTRALGVTQALERFPMAVPPGNYSVVSVCDDGAGIPEETLPRIFELHFTTKSRHGTGIGLATVLDIVESHSGYLTVDTSPDGTCFELYFKVADSS